MIFTRPRKKVCKIKRNCVEQTHILGWCFVRSAINHHVAFWLQGEEKGKKKEEGGAKALARSQNVTDAKVAAMEEVGEGKHLLNDMHGWTVTDRGPNCD